MHQGVIILVGVFLFLMIMQSLDLIMMMMVEVILDLPIFSILMEVHGLKNKN